MKNKRLLIIFLTTLLLFANLAISKGYSHWENNNDKNNEALNVGDWNYMNLFIGPEFGYNLVQYMISPDQ